MAREFAMTRTRKFGNAVLGRLISLGVAPKSMHLLTVAGRRTGEPHTTPVNVIDNADGRWLVSPYGEVDWVRNARAAGEVTLRRGSAVQIGRVIEVRPDRAAPVLRQYLEDVPVTQPYFDVRPDSPTGEFAAEARRHPVFAVEPVAEH